MLSVVAPFSFYKDHLHLQSFKLCCWKKQKWHALIPWKVKLHIRLTPFTPGTKVNKPLIGQISATLLMFLPASLPFTTNHPSPFVLRRIRNPRRRIIALYKYQHFCQPTLPICTSPLSLLIANFGAFLPNILTRWNTCRLIYTADLVV